MTTTPEIVQHGWLTKSPPAKGLFKPRWRRRWFILRTGSYPNQFVLEYFTDESRRRLKGQINLDECEQIAAPLSVQDRHKYTFNLRTPSRVYYLAADTEPEMNKWVTCLCQVCGLKTVEEEGTEMYTRPGDENNQPEVMDNHESDESSPSVSESISEVNWATHPAKKEGSDAESVSAQPERPVATAPPRPPKKTVSAITATNSPQCIESSKPLLQSASTRNCFSYDNFEETHDSSSTCSSLHSPPGSAGALYSNITDISPVYQNPPSISGNPVSQSQMNLSTTPADSSARGTLPPKVDRNLKPDLRKPIESPSYKSFQQQSPTGSYPSKHSSGAMTLPSSKSSQRQVSGAGPKFDRNWKAPDSKLTLGPTPAQIKGQAANNFAKVPTVKCQSKCHMNTLPSSQRRRVGPAISPHGKKPQFFHEYEPPPELIYLQIDSKTSEGDPRHTSSKISHTRSPSASHAEDAGSVEYKLIDHVKTQALNHTRQDREEQLRANHGSKNLK
ncbi:unnamed protein product [Allacma fusca]|uniref:PH domain-containing protein n=1 Tax=Allacma fusca TaxID=39272 RepID=A0A8J2KEU8_9HEXA|nr:unnamed protein product [Allacma fusca]